MKSYFTTILATALMAIACVAANPSNAHAQNAPYVEEFQFEEVNSPVANCGDFIMIANGLGKIRLTTYFDRNGDAIRLIFQGRYNGTLTNSVSGATISDSPSVANIFVDLVANTQTNIGAFYNLTIPGRGAVLIEAGRLVLSGDGEPTFIAGPHRPTDDTYEILCNALR